MVFAFAGDSTITSCIVVWDVPEVWALRVYVRIRAKMGFGLEGRQASLLRVKLRVAANDPIAVVGSGGSRLQNAFSNCHIERHRFAIFSTPR